MVFDPNEVASPDHAKSKTVVWWDIDTCPVPDGYDARRAVGSIECALKDLGYKGPLTITAVGDMEKNRKVLRELCSTGIKIEHSIPDRTGFAIHLGLSDWREHNEPPATIMLISDKVEEEMIWPLCRSQQEQSGYNLLLGYSVSIGNASILHTTAQWVWKDLLAAAKEGETRGHVLRKCTSGSGESASLLLCTSCDFTGQSLEEFITHLSSQEHAEQETELIEYRALRPSPEPEVEEPLPKTKRSRKADFRLLPYHLAKRKRSRKAFRKDFRLLQDHLRLLHNHLGRLHDHLGRLLRD